MAVQEPLQGDYAAQAGNARFLLPALFVGGAACFVLLLAWPSKREADSQRQSADALPVQVGVDPKLDETIPLDLVFRNEQGREVVLDELLGEKPVILNLMYLRCPML
jgi:protein SCO1/2